MISIKNINFDELNARMHWTVLKCDIRKWTYFHFQNVCAVWQNQMHCILTVYRVYIVYTMIPINFYGTQSPKNNKWQNLCIFRMKLHNNVELVYYFSGHILLNHVDAFFVVIVAVVILLPSLYCYQSIWHLTLRCV